MNNIILKILSFFKKYSNDKKYYINGRWWYKTREDCNKERKKGEMIYYDARMNSYYLIKIPKRRWYF